MAATWFEFSEILTFLYLDPENEGSTTATPREPLQFFRGRKGGRCVAYNGYIYTHDRTKADGKEFWQCRDRKKFVPNCVGRLYTRQERVIREKNPSDIHSPSEKECSRSLAVSTMKYDESRSTPAAVVRKVLTTVPTDVKAILPSPENMKKQIRNRRKLTNATPTNPFKLADLVLPEEYTKNAAGN